MLVEIDKLRLSLDHTPVLQDVRLSLDAGEIYGLLGPNGAGKSTTIAVALGLVKPDAGRVRVFGRDPLTAAHANYGNLGVLPEQSGFYGWMSAEKYLAFFAELHGRHPGPNEMRRRLSDVGLEPRPGQTIATYSRGMRQRLALARALIADPMLLILDEPTNGLDPRDRREIHDILLGLASKGVGILLCTHLLDDIERLCRRVGIIVDGRTVAEGPIADLARESGQFSRFRLRLTGDAPESEVANRVASVVGREGDWWLVDVDAAAQPDVVWRVLMLCGWPIAEIRRETGGLEDIYLTMTERNAA